jgi:hypothetical protein
MGQGKTLLTGYRSPGREGLLALDWRRDADGYELSADGRSIVRRGGRLVPYDPAAVVDPPLHFLFGALGAQIGHGGEVPGGALADEFTSFRHRRFASEPDALLAFVREFGFLGGSTWSAEGREGSEPLEYIARHRRDLSSFFDFAGKGAGYAEAFNARAPEVEVRLIPGATHQQRLQLVPRTLIAWIWLRVAEDATAGLRWAGDPCEYCGMPMPRGQGGRRSHARFCSDKCRVYGNRRDKASQQTKRKASKRKGEP